MMPYSITTNKTTCTINGVASNYKDRTTYYVPSYVTSISKGAFSGCSAMESITLPFTGQSRTAIYTSA